MARPCSSGLDGYAEAARCAAAGETCSPGDAFGAAQYDDLTGVPDGAVRASLGCGNPTAIAELRPGDVVLDLGAGGGLDVLLSARAVGSAGYVYGLDATLEMVELARRNVAEAGVTNVQLLHGSIEHIPLGAGAVDVVISNCVIVLSPDKDATFGDIARVLRPGGRVSISDIVRIGVADGAAAVDCGDDAIGRDAYADALHSVGLGQVHIEPTEPLGGGLANAIIRATKPSSTPSAPSATR